MSIKYAKVINQITNECEVGIGTNEAFYKSIGFTQLDVEQCEWNNKWYLKGRCPNKPAPTIEEQISDLKNKLSDLDEKSNRSMRAILVGTATDDDRTYLANIEEQVATLRQQIRELEAQLQ